MKKKYFIVLAVILILVICVCAWFYGYHTGKSNDNLPSLTAISEMSESEVNSLLAGYQIEQLQEVWGEPDACKDNECIWVIDDVTLIVNYKNNGVVAVCGLKDVNGTSVDE